MLRPHVNSNEKPGISVNKMITLCYLKVTLILRHAIPPIYRLRNTDQTSGN